MIYLSVQKSHGLFCTLRIRHIFCEACTSRKISLRLGHCAALPLELPRCANISTQQHMFFYSLISVCPAVNNSCGVDKKKLSTMPLDMMPGFSALQRFSQLRIAGFTAPFLRLHFQRDIVTSVQAKCKHDYAAISRLIFEYMRRRRGK